MSLNSTEKLGVNAETLQIMRDSQADLQAKGLNVTAWITEQSALNDAAVADGNAQEMARAEAKTKTAAANQSADKAYRSASSKLEAMEGVLGKDTEAGKRIRRLRSTIKRGSAAKKPAGG